MKPSYAPDNTRSSMAVILLLAAGVTIVALLLGLSEKPDIDAIGVAVTPEEALELTANAAIPVDPDEADDDGLDAAFSVPAPEPADVEDAGATATTGTAEVQVDESGAPIPADETAGAAPAVTAIPIPEPTATPEIVAAVEPTPAPDTESDDALDALAAPARITPGTVGGAFFVGGFEDEGANILGNEISLTLNEDGTGAFTGTLDMSMLDETRVTLSMSGPFEWSSVDSPQVIAELAGNYVSDSLNDADDVAATDAELTITSLGSGSGALCATDSTCFGFRFPAQTGF